MYDMSELQWVLAFLVGILATARLTRLLVFDDFPPTKWIRSKWDDWTDNNGWNELLHCAFCASFYIGAFVVAIGFASGFHPAWWATCSVLAGSYVAAMIVASDWG